MLDRLQSTPLTSMAVRYDLTGCSPIYREPWMAAEQSLWAGPTTVSPPEPSRFSQWLEGTWRSKGHRPLREDNGNEQPITELHMDLDNILDKLQEMLASNFSLAG